jgi:hypothetical protein
MFNLVSHDLPFRDRRDYGFDALHVAAGERILGVDVRC